MKPKMMVHGSLARCISSPEEVERLLSQGWLIGAPKAKSKFAKNVRTLRAKRRDEGWLQIDMWLPPDVIALVKSARLPAESYGALLVRLVKLLGQSDENHIVDAHNRKS